MPRATKTKKKPVVRHATQFSIYLSPGLNALVKRYQQDHPEVALSKLCAGFLGQYLYDRGYVIPVQEGTP